MTLAVQPSPQRRSEVLASSPSSRPSPRTAEVATLLRALGDPTRLAIAAMLARQTEPLCVCHLEASFSLSQSTISHHLRVLRDAGLVTSEKRGTWVYYAASRERIARVAGLTALLESVAPTARRGECCT